MSCETRASIEEAFARLSAAGGSPSIADVTREVGVSPGLIRKCYGDIADRILEASGRSPRQRREALALEVSALKEELSKTRQALEMAKKDLTRIASLNLTLTLENRRLKDPDAKSTVVPFRGGKRSRK